MRKLLFILFFSFQLSPVSAQVDQNYSLEIIELGENSELKEECSKYLMVKFNCSDSLAFSDLKYYQNDQDSTVFSISFCDTNCFFIQSETFVLPLYKGLQVKSKSEQKEIKKYLTKEFKCDCTKQERKERLGRIFWQIENGVLSSGVSF